MYTIPSHYSSISPDPSTFLPFNTNKNPEKDTSQYINFLEKPEKDFCTITCSDYS